MQPDDRFCVHCGRQIRWDGPRCFDCKGKPVIFPQNPGRGPEFDRAHIEKLVSQGVEPVHIAERLGCSTQLVYDVTSGRRRRKSNAA